MRELANETLELVKEFDEKRELMQQTISEIQDLIATKVADLLNNDYRYDNRNT